MTRLPTLIILSILLLLLAACGSGAEELPVPATATVAEERAAPEPEPTEAPTEEAPTEVPEPTEEAAAAPTEESAATQEATAQPTAAPTEAPVAELPDSFPELESGPAMLDAAAMPTGEMEYGWSMFSNGNYVEDVLFHEGRLWAATRGGLVAWDPATGESRKWTTLEGLVHNEARVLTLCPMPEQRLVVGTKHGVSLFDPASESFENWTPEHSDMGGTLGWSQVTGLGCNPEAERLYIGYNGGNFDIYNLATGEWTLIDDRETLGSGNPGTFAFVGDQVWIARGLSVGVLAPGGNRYYDEDNSDLPNRFVSDVVVDRSGTVWLGSGDGPIRVNEDGSFTLFDDESVTDSPTIWSVDDMALAPDGTTLWISSGFGSICHFDPAASACVETFPDDEGMVGSFAGGLDVDAQGNVAYGSVGEGVSYYSGGAWQAWQRDERLVSNELTALAQAADGMIWVGTDSKGAQSFDPTTPDAGWTSYAGEIPNLSIEAFLATDEGMWVGHGSGVSFRDAASGEWLHYPVGEGGPPAPASIVQTASGELWVGTERDGIYVWDGDSFSIMTEEDGLPAAGVNQLLATGDVVWAGTGRGLARYEEGAWALWNSSNSELRSNSIYALAQAADGSLLIGADRTLLRLTADGTWEDVQRFLDAVRGIATGSDGVTILIGTFKDGAYYHGGTEWRHLIPEDGMPALEYFHPQLVLVDHLGTFWFGGAQGGLARWVP